MGLGRFFSIRAEYKSGCPITDESLADQIESDLDAFYRNFEGSILDGNELTLGDANWFDCNRDMKTIAEKYPDILFTLFCSGQSLDDTWIAGYCGEKHDCQGVFIPDLNYDYLRNP